MSLGKKKVEFKSRPDLSLYVRALSANQALDLQAGLHATADGDVRMIIALQLAAFVVKDDDSLAFPTPQDAVKFMDTVREGVVTKLVKAGAAFNKLDDEAIEEEQKN